MYPLERWIRTFFVCLCLWLGSPLSMQQPGAADSNEWADGVDSVIAASGGFSSLAMRRRFDEASRRRRRRHGCSRTEDGYEELHSSGFPSPTVHVVHKRSSRVCFCALTCELSRAWRQGA